MDIDPYAESFNGGGDGPGTTTKIVLVISAIIVIVILLSFLLKPSKKTDIERSCGSYFISACDKPYHAHRMVWPRWWLR